MTPRQAREAAGLSPEQAAKRARICVAYLRRVERACERRAGGDTSAPLPSPALAGRLAAVYGCRVDIFYVFQARPAVATALRQTECAAPDAHGE
jgi:transcriptional regulator with XRE-family HTH domain